MFLQCRSSICLVKLNTLTLLLHAHSFFYRCSMTIRSIGFVFILAFPGAYVSIDTPCLDDHNYSPTDHLRVVLAGVLNNAAFWLVSQMVYASVIGSTIGTLLLHVGGFTNVNEVGVAVQIVDNVSHSTLNPAYTSMEAECP